MDGFDERQSTSSSQFDLTPQIEVPTPTDVELASTSFVSRKVPCWSFSSSSIVLSGREEIRWLYSLHFAVS